MIIYIISIVLASRQDVNWAKRELQQVLGIRYLIDCMATTVESLNFIGGGGQFSWIA